MAFPFTDDLRDNVTTNLSAFDPVAIDDDGLITMDALIASLDGQMVIRVQGNAGQRRSRKEARNRVIRMEFATYLNSLMLIPAQIIRTARQRTFRLLSYRPSVDLLFTMHDHISLPLRC